MRSMTRWMFVGMVGLMIAGLSVAALAQEEGAKVKSKKGGKGAKPEVIALDKCPEAVQAGIKKEAGTNEVKEVAVITRGDKKIYRATWMVEGKEVKKMFDEEGKVMTKPEGAKKEKKTEGGEAGGGEAGGEGGGE